MVPFLVLYLAMPQRQAQGTSLFVVFFSAVAGTIVYCINGSVDFIAALILALGAVWSVPIGVDYSHKILDHTLRKYFGVLLVFIAVLLFFKSYLPFTFIPPTMPIKICILVMIGLATGFISGLMGIGGGAITVSALVILTGMSQQVAQGSSLFAMLPIAAIGSYRYWKLGSIETSCLPGIIGGMIAGTILGGNLALWLPSKILTQLFSLFLILLSIQYFRRGISATSAFNKRCCLKLH